ncbi:MAG TPA: hypothetical protein VGE21_07510 [Flavobacteriales bacterium]
MRNPIATDRLCTYAGLISVTLVSSCVYDPPEDVDRRLAIKNATTSGIYYLVSRTDSLDRERGVERFLNARMTDAEGRVIDSVRTSYVKPFSTETIAQFRPFDVELEASPNDTLYLFAFKDSLLGAMDWEQLVRDQVWSGRGVITRQLLKGCPCVLTYPDDFATE